MGTLYFSLLLIFRELKSAFSHLTHFPLQGESHRLSLDVTNWKTKPGILNFPHLDQDRSHVFKTTSGGKNSDPNPILFNTKFLQNPSSQGPILIPKQGCSLLESLTKGKGDKVKGTDVQPFCFVLYVTAGRPPSRAKQQSDDIVFY